MHYDKIESFKDFENCFINDLWSERDQLAYKDAIFAEKFRSVKKDESLSDFFERNYSKAVKYFPLISFEEIKIKFSAQVPGIQNFDVLIANTSNYVNLKNQLKSFDSCKTVRNNYGNKNIASSSKQTESSHKEDNDKQNDRHKNSSSNSHNKPNNYHRGNNRYQPYYKRNTDRRNDSSKQQEHGVFNIQEVSNVPHAHSGQYSQNHRAHRGRGGGRRQNYYRRGANSNGRNFDLAHTVKSMVEESIKNVMQTAGATIGGTSNQTTRVQPPEN
jgi:hypothetical protein